MSFLLKRVDFINKSHRNQLHKYNKSTLSRGEKYVECLCNGLSICDLELTRQANEWSTTILYLYFLQCLAHKIRHGHTNITQSSPMWASVRSESGWLGPWAFLPEPSDAVLATGSTHFVQLVEVDVSTIVYYIICLSQPQLPKSHFSAFRVQTSAITKQGLRWAVHFRTAEAELWHWLIADCSGVFFKKTDA